MIIVRNIKVVILYIYKYNGIVQQNTNV